MVVVTWRKGVLVTGGDTLVTGVAVTGVVVTGSDAFATAAATLVTDALVTVDVVASLGVLRVARLSSTPS